MSGITRDQIAGAIRAVTGDPASGPVRDITPQIVDAIWGLIGADEQPKETRIIKAPETRKGDKDGA